MGSMHLNGKVAIITGGGSGIGKATSLALAKSGAKVIIAGRDESELLKVREDIELQGGTAEAIPTDVSVESQCISLVEDAVSKFGRLDILINNAVAFESAKKKVLDLSIEELEHGYAFILRGPYILCREAIPHLMKSDEASIVNLISIGSRRCCPEEGLENSMNLALRAMTVVLSKELRQKAPQIRVHTVHPADVKEGLISSEKKLVSPEEIAELIMRLVSHEGNGMIDEVTMRPVDADYYCYP